jgi:hypothetical protein
MAARGSAPTSKPGSSDGCSARSVSPGGPGSPTLWLRSAPFGRSRRGDPGRFKIEAFERLVRPFGLIEMARTGEIAISRGRGET